MSIINVKEKESEKMEILKIGIVYDLSICLKIIEKMTCVIFIHDIFPNKNSASNKI